MNFLREIKKCVEIGRTEITASPYGVYVSGVKRITLLSPDRVILECDGCCLEICGNALKITKLCDGDAGFSGKICGVNFL